jgi:hypothetical protein
MKVSGQLHDLPLYPRGTTVCTHWTGGWVGLGVLSGSYGGRKNLKPAGNRTDIGQALKRLGTNLATPSNCHYYYYYYYYYYYCCCCCCRHYYYYYYYYFVSQFKDNEYPM